MVFAGLKPRCDRATSFLEQGESAPLPFPAPGCLFISFSSFKASTVAASNINLTLTFFLSLPYFIDPCDYIGATWVVQDDVSISRFLT